MGFLGRSWAKEGLSEVSGAYPVVSIDLIILVESVVFMPKYPWFKFFPGDWLKDPQLNMCGLSTQGFWMKALCCMHETDSATLTGTPQMLARVVGCEESEVQAALAELKLTRAATIRENDNGTISVTCQRKKREEKTQKLSNNRKQNFRSKQAETNHGTKVERGRNAVGTGKMSEVRNQNIEKEKIKEKKTLDVEMADTGTAQAPEQLKLLDTGDQKLMDDSFSSQQTDMTGEAASCSTDEVKLKGELTATTRSKGGSKPRGRPSGLALAHDEAVEQAVLPEHLDSLEIRDLLRQWADQRRKNRKFLTVEAMAMTMRKLGEFHASEVVTALEDAICGGYSGVFPKALPGAWRQEDDVNVESRTIYEPEF